MKVKEKLKNTEKSEKKEKKGSAQKRVEFSLYAPEAREVYLSGDFNQWDTQSLPMKKNKNGYWKTKVQLPVGIYEYKVFVDNAWVHDIPDTEKVPNPFGTENCVIRVE